MTSKETAQLATGAQSSAEVITTIPVGARPTGVAVHPVTLQVFVVNADDGTVSVIDSSTFRVIATIPVGLSPQFVAVDPDRTTVGVTNFGDGTVSVIDTGTLTVTKTIPAGNRPYGIAAANNLFWVTNPDSGTVSKIKPKIGQVIGTFPVGAHSGVQPPYLCHQRRRRHGHCDRPDGQRGDRDHPGRAKAVRGGGGFGEPDLRSQSGQ